MIVLCHTVVVCLCLNYYLLLMRLLGLTMRCAVVCNRILLCPDVLSPLSCARPAEEGPLS
jgi:hypothetical protein